MPPGVLVTRPLPQAEATARRLRALGYDPVLSPMLRIEAVDPLPALDLNDVHAVLFTSLHGVRHFAAATETRALRVFAVGERTAQAAREAGFADVLSADGDAAALTDLVRDRTTPEAGAILHARGEDVAASPLAALKAEGYRTREAILYRAVIGESLSPQARAAFAEGRIAAILVYSPRSAAALTAALQDGPDLSGTVAAAISENALAPLAPLRLHERSVAAEPTEAALLDALHRVLPA